MSTPDAPLPLLDATRTDDVAPETPSAPHRAPHRRTTLVRSTALPYAVGAGGLILAGLIALPALVPPSTPNAPDAEAPVASAKEGPPAADPSLTALRTALDGLERDAAALTKKVRDAERDAVVVELESDTALLMQQIRTARDDRRKAKPRPKLSAPFTTEELAPAADALRLSKSRMVIDRLGRVILPKGATLPEGIAVKSERIDTDRLSVTVSKSESETVVLARACVPYERHCLVEVRTLPLTQLSINAVTDAVATLRPTPAAGVAAVVPSTTTRPPTPASGEPWNLIFAVLLALGSVISFFWIRRALSRGLQSAEQRLWAAANGTPNEGSPATGTPIDNALRAVEVHVRALTAQASRRRAEAECRDDLTAALSAATRGDFTARAAVDDDDALFPVALAVNQLLSRTDDRFARLRTTSASPDDDALATLRRHLGQLAPLADLLRDVGERLDVLAQATGGPPPSELGRLADQVRKRSEVAGRLIETLGRDAEALSAAAPEAPAQGPLRGVVTSQGPLLELYSERAFPAPDAADAA